MSPEEREFEEELGAAFRALRERRGPCPSAEALSAYQAGSLEPGEADRVRAHVAVCGLCDSLLVRLKDFDAPGPPPSPVSWPAAERRMRARVFAGANPWWRRLGGLFWRPAPAYALAGIVLLAAVAVRRIADTPPAALRQHPARSIELQVSRSGEPGAPPEDFVVLSFWIPPRPGLRYSASLDGAPPSEIARDDGGGNFHVPYPAARAGKGRHRLLVAGTDRQTGKVEQQVQFEFEGAP
ncbi:MAG: zf-HC2 domain-containing protein [Acidobacteria bacterium]|nr:zf-HC2 domain-containing protein [Acidobacteriota bacterium]